MESTVEKTPAAIPAPNSPVTPNSPGQVGSWESDLDAFVSTTKAGPAPAPAPAAPEKPAAAPAPAPATPAKAADQPAATKPASAPAKTAPPATGHKAKLDPDDLLAVDGVDSVELPETVMTALKTLDARDLRLQSAKLAQRLRTVAVEMKRKETELESLKTREDPEKQALIAERTELQKRYEATQKELAHTAYLKSDEYIEKFQKPFERTLAEAYELVKEFTVNNPDETTRQATTKDLDEILEAPRGAAARIAREKFGDGAEDILHYARKLFDLRRDAARSVEDYRKQGEEIEKKRLAEQTQIRETHQRIWKQATEEIPQKYPELFGKHEDDPEGNEILDRAYAEVDRSNDPNLKTEERIARTAVVRHRAAAFAREFHRRKKLEARVAELEKIVSDYESSVPTSGSKDGAPPPSTNDGDDAFAELDRIAQAKQ